MYMYSKFDLSTMKIYPQNIFQFIFIDLLIKLKFNDSYLNKFFLLFIRSNLKLLCPFIEFSSLFSNSLVIPLYPIFQ